MSILPAGDKNNWKPDWEQDHKKSKKRDRRHERELKRSRKTRPKETKKEKKERKRLKKKKKKRAKFLAEGGIEGQPKPKREKPSERELAAAVGEQPASQQLEFLSDFGFQIQPNRLRPVKGRSLSELALSGVDPRVHVGPQVLVICGAAKKSCELIKDLAPELRKSVAKLFAKHMKLAEQSAFLAHRDSILLGIGTPNRIIALSEAGALKLKRVRLIILDVGANPKGQTMFNIKQLAPDILAALKKTKEANPQALYSLWKGSPQPSEQTKK